MCEGKDTQWALYAKSVLDRTRLALTNKAESYQKILQPSAEYLGSLLGVENWAVCIVFSLFNPSVFVLLFLS
jgi:alpha-glucan,water dikinase